jgi:hypothetical protein
MFYTDTKIKSIEPPDGLTANAWVPLVEPVGNDWHFRVDISNLK